MPQTLAIIQARTGSTRLPNKVLKDVNGQPIIKWQIDRVKRVEAIDLTVLATTTEREDDPLASLAEENGLKVFRGDSKDVLSRFYLAINEIKPKTIVRITGDCPLFMPSLCEEMIHRYYQEGCDYFSNTLTPTWPDGCDIEIMDHNSFAKLRTFKLNDLEKEHVTLGIYNRPEIFDCRNYLNSSDESHHRWTLDDQEDLTFIREVYRFFEGREISFSYSDVMNLIGKQMIKPRLDGGGMRNSALKKP